MSPRICSLGMSILLALAFHESTLAQTFPESPISERFIEVEKRIAFTRSTIDALRRDIQLTLDSAVADVDETISARTGFDQRVYPSSDIIGNSISIPDGFILKMVYLSAFSRTMSVSTHDLACMELYIDQIRDSAPPVPPVRFVSENVETCSDFAARFPVSLTTTYLVSNEIKATIKFSYLHELGHFYHSHRHIPTLVSPDTPQGLCELSRLFELYRAYEYEADAFALKQMFALGIQRDFLLVDAFWQVSFSDMGQLPVFSEISHPHKLHRRTRLLELYIDLADPFGEDTTIIRDAVRAYQGIENEVAGIEDSLDVPDPCG